MANGTAYLYNFQTALWTNRFFSITFSQTLGLQALTDAGTGRIYIPNGDANTTTNTTSLLRLNMATNTWEVLPMEAGISAMVDYGSAWSTATKSMYMLGGTLFGSTSSVLYNYDPATGWTAPASKGTSPPMRSSACLVSAYNGTKLVMFGGESEKQATLLNDIYFLDVLTMTWTRGPDTDLNSARAMASCAVTNDNFVVWGGFNSAQAMTTNVVLVYNMRTNQWTSTFDPTSPTPTPSKSVTATSTTAAPTSTTPSTPTPVPRPIWPIILGVIIALIIIIVGIIVVFRYRNRMKRTKDLTYKGGEESNYELTGKPKDKSDDKSDNGSGSAVFNTDYAEKEKKRYSHLRAPATEEDPFGSQRWDDPRGPSTAGFGAKDDRRALFTADGSRRFSHLRGPTLDDDKSSRRSSSRRNPTEGDVQRGFDSGKPHRFSHLRGPATTTMGAQYEDAMDDVEEAEEHLEDDFLAAYQYDNNDHDYMPPPPMAIPQSSPSLSSRSSSPRRPQASPRTREPELRTPLSIAVKGLPAPPGRASRSSRASNARSRLHRAPATYERESVFGHADSLSLRGGPQQGGWEA
ncbi:hypothetical protein BGZ98_010397 [Dissophora globulifera]|nr:hypothetical protein BGZ98_010397 [Dissophora globulifera]